jgi:gas vesicle protein
MKVFVILILGALVGAAGFLFGTESGRQKKDDLFAKAKKGASSAGDLASDVADKATDSASDLADTVSDTAGDVADKVSAIADDAVKSAKSAVDHSTN